MRERGGGKKENKKQWKEGIWQWPMPAQKTVVHWLTWDWRVESLTMYYCLSKIMEKRQMEMYREREGGYFSRSSTCGELLVYTSQLNSNCRFTHTSCFFFDVLDCYCFFLLSDWTLCLEVWVWWNWPQLSCCFMLGFFLSCSWKYISFVLLLMDGDSLSIILGATRCPHAS